MLANERIVVQMRIGCVDAIDLVLLSRAKRFLWIEAPCALQQTLAPQDFVQPCDATSKAVGCVEKGRIRVGDFDAVLKKFSGSAGCAPSGGLAFAEEFHRAPGPDGPVA
jgi:hypothetical protein